ncbi:Membrane fusion protein Use1 [Nesidiocoris tenuis]|uniref:Vesicle transport protein USE1 n=1 Tax=Nesidiocoris tenuis TaxID=355587 RepID=A0ABN7AGC0_9HEMI|nr:Membrane fusion protein Use1 [Nesidiocoris tenuis]
MGRQVIDLSRLLERCEAMAKDGLGEDEWRLKEFVKKAAEILADLKKKPGQPDDDIVRSFENRVVFLEGFLGASAAKNNPLERAHLIATVSNSHATEETSNIYHAEVQKVQSEIRENLFSKKSELRLRKNATESTLFGNLGEPSTPTDTDDADALLSYHHSLHENIAENMIGLAKNIKEQSLIANTIIKGDTKRVENSALLADKNITYLKKNSDKLQEHTRSNWQCWTWLLLLVVLASFISMVLVMKLFKKKM